MNTPKIRFKGFKDAWEQRKLSDCAEFRRGSFPQPYGNKDWYDGKGAMPFVQVADVSSDMKLVNDTKQKISKLAQPMSVFAEKGSVLVTLQGSIGRVAITQYGAFVDRTVLIFDKYKDDIDKKFWAYIIKEKFEYEAKKAPGGTIKTITKEVLANFDLMLPCYAEQSILADYLIKLDHLITLHQRKCDETKELKKFMLQKMFPKNGEKNPEIRFEGFTDDWEQRKLGEVCEIKDSARIPNSEWSESGVPYIRASDVTNENTDGVLFISQERYEFYKNRTGAPTKDDVLFNGGGEIGKSLLITDEKPIYVQGGAVLYAQTSKSRELVGQYLKTYFETTNAKSYIDAASAGGTMRHFTLKPSQIMRILMPSVEEQEKIGEYFANLDQLITLHQRKCEKLKELKKFMLKNMFV